MMINKTNWQRIIYSGIILIMIVILILSIFIIPNAYTDTSPGARPESAVTAFLVVILIHLLLVIGFITTIKFSFRKDDLKNGFLVTIGVVLILQSLLLLDAAFAFLKHSDIPGTAIAIFICIGLDIISCTLSFVARYFRGHLSPAE